VTRPRSSVQAQSVHSTRLCDSRQTEGGFNGLSSGSEVDRQDFQQAVVGDAAIDRRSDHRRDGEVRWRWGTALLRNVRDRRHGQIALHRRRWILARSQQTLEGLDVEVVERAVGVDVAVGLASAISNGAMSKLLTTPSLFMSPIKPCELTALTVTLIVPVALMGPPEPVLPWSLATSVIVSGPL